MFELNLIRQKRTVIRTRKRHILYFRSAFGILAVILLAVGVRLVLVVRELVLANGEKAKIVADIKTSKSRHGIDALQKEWADYYGRLSAVERLNGARSEYAVLLQQLSAQVPPGVCFDTIEVDASKKTLSLGLIVVPDGDKQEFEIVENFISLLNSAAYVAPGANLASHQRQNINGREMETFKITVPLKGA